ncbi:MAG: universal stress protein, partial [Gemmatimonadaceae bacterium]|nr:universal stress protein [Gemmatimonadaceae bacterium]
MYTRILVCLENSATDQHIVEHVTPLARLCGASLVLIHVADGWAARNIKHLDLQESEEMREDRAYLDRVASQFVAAGVPAEALLATGDPASEISAAADREG